jgi:hypothetical protein
MFCPRCKAEYRQGFTRCADCEAELVDQLPDETPPTVRLESVWTGEDREDCVFMCQRLKAAGIPFTVNQSRHQFWKGVDEQYEIIVPADVTDKARTEIAKRYSEFRDEEEQVEILGLPTDDADSVGGGPRDFKPWYPEDATVEIYSECTRDNEEQKAWMIEAGLRENLIRSRTEDMEDGSRKVFVMPDDETQAREIVREITDGTPPA